MQQSAQPVDVPCNEVAAQPGGKGQGQFQVDVMPHIDASQGGQRQGFCGNIGLKAPAFGLKHGQTDTGNQDAVSRLALPEVEATSREMQADIISRGRSPQYLPLGFNDSGKHVTPRPGTACGSDADASAYLRPVGVFR